MRRVLAFAVLSALLGCAHEPGAQRPMPPPARFRVTTARVEPWTATERARLAATLDRTFAGDAWRGAGIAVLRADGAPLYERRGASPMTPASTLKLLVAAAALATFGPSLRFDTTLVALEKPQAGILNGPLWLVGGGDPLFASSDLREGVGALVRAGVREVRGDLIVDASPFAGPEQNARWDPSDLSYDYAAGTSAISLDWDVAGFMVAPGVPGEPARVRVEPPSANVRFSGSILTSSEGYGSDVHIDRDAYVPGGSDRNEFSIGGRIAAGVAQTFYRPVRHIPRYAGDVMATMLAARGIVLDGTVRVGIAPLAARTLWRHRSAPVAQLLREMLVHSDNHTAEQLLRLLGWERGFGGTDTGGLRVERAFLAQRAVDANGARAFDASGLAPADRIAPRALAQILIAATGGRYGAYYLRALPLAGLEGTVRYHRLGAALGRVRAKSGHIDEVNALAGLIATRHHGRLAFAFVVNGPQADAGDITRSTDAALDGLVEF